MSKIKYRFGLDGESFPFGDYPSRELAIAAAVREFEPTSGAIIYLMEEYVFTQHDDELPCVKIQSEFQQVAREP